LEREITGLVLVVSLGELAPGRFSAQEKQPRPIFQPFLMRPRDWQMLEKSIQDQSQKSLNLYKLASQAKPWSFKQAVISLHLLQKCTKSSLVGVQVTSHALSHTFGFVEIGHDIFSLVSVLEREYPHYQPLIYLNP
jgi:hypothetical protein